MDSETKPYWVVARTQTNRENWAAENVARQGREFYLPRIKEVRVQSGRAMELARPLFPCYLFVQIDGAWRFLTGTFGVAGVVLNGDRPAVLPDDAIARIKALEVEGYVQLPTPPERAKLARGEKVMITSGVFAGASGVYDGMGAADRQRVLLDYLGRRTVVLVPEDAITAAEPSPTQTSRSQAQAQIANPRRTNSPLVL